MRDRINAIVKKRESFRPFAPSVLESHRDAHFDLDIPLRSGLRPLRRRLAQAGFLDRSRLAGGVRHRVFGSFQFVDNTKKSALLHLAGLAFVEICVERMINVSTSTPPQIAGGTETRRTNLFPPHGACRRSY